MRVMLKVYGECVEQTFRSLKKGPWMVLLPWGYFVALMVGGSLVAPLGMVGGFLLGIFVTMLTSSALYFVGEVVAGHKIRLSEMGTSLFAYFWNVMAVGFVLWIFNLVLAPLLASTPKGGAISMVIQLVLFVLLNAVPEIIYQQGHPSGLAMISRSVTFIHENWIEWFLPAAVLLGVVWAPLSGLSWLGLGGWAALVGTFTVPLLLMPVMVFRGHLYAVLSTSTPRQRAFKYRAG